MKNLFAILVIIFISLKIFGSGQAAEIYFYQDSVLSNKIYVKLKVLTEPIYDGSMKDSAFILWGDGTSSLIPRIDTIRVNGVLGTGYPLYNSTFLGSHTYNSSYMNSLVTIGYDDGPRLTGIRNMAVSNNQGFYICTVVNFKMLQNIYGYSSPYFEQSLYKGDTTDKTVIYDPQITIRNSLKTQIKLVTPLNTYLSYVSGYVRPNEVPPLGTDTLLTCDSISGLFTWDYPELSGLYDITYQITQYVGDTLVSSVMQDMLVTIASGPSGIDVISSSSLRCYPSPSSTTFTIDMSVYTAGERQVAIYDQLGRLVYHTTTTLDQLHIDTPLSAGIYTISVTQDTHREYARIVRE